MTLNRIELERYADVLLPIEAELGRCRLSIRALLNLQAGTTLRLSRSVGEDLPIYVGGALIGRGEAIRLNQTMGIRLTVFSSMP
jgi:flagellar motor switch/type III secretory pathway protein FliN